jgi:hypothetical protein
MSSSKGDYPLQKCRVGTDSATVATVKGFLVMTVHKSDAFVS